MSNNLINREMCILVYKGLPNYAPTISKACIPRNQHENTLQHITLQWE